MQTHNAAMIFILSVLVFHTDLDSFKIVVYQECFIGRNYLFQRLFEGLGSEHSCLGDKLADEDNICAALELRVARSKLGCGNVAHLNVGALYLDIHHGAVHDNDTVWLYLVDELFQ